MAKKNKSEEVYNLAEKMPDEINALKATVKEFMDRMQNLDNEISLLNQDKKDLEAEFSERLDMSTLKAALQVLKIQSKVKHRDAYDLFLETLTDPAQ